MFIIDRADGRRLRAETDPTKWHAVCIWVPRFVLASHDGTAPRWTFVWFGRTLRRSIASETIGDTVVHRWVYQTDSIFA